MPNTGIYSSHVCQWFAMAAAIAMAAMPGVAVSASGALNANSQHTLAFAEALRAQQIGDLEGARKMWEALLKKVPRSPEVLNNLAALARAEGRETDALQFLEQAASLHPRYASIEHNLAVSRISLESPLSASSRTETMQLRLIEAPPVPGIVAATLNKLNTSSAIAASLPAPTDRGTDRISSSVAGSTPASNITAGYRPTPPDESVGDHFLRSALYSWVVSWMRRDVRAYLAYYDSDFTPPKNLSRAQWELRRNARLRSAQNIEIHITDLQISAGDTTDVMLTRFVQHYRSPSFQDQVLKTVLWRQRNGEWRIIAETP